MKIGLIFPITALLLCSGCDDHSGPKMHAKWELIGDVSFVAKILQIVSDDPNSFTVQRVVLNNREKEKGCDFSFAEGTDNPPKTLREGDSTFVIPDCGSEVEEIQVYTDRGTVELSVN
jgi:hypothetical protein